MKAFIKKYPMLTTTAAAALVLAAVMAVKNFSPVLAQTVSSRLPESSAAQSVAVIVPPASSRPQASLPESSFAASVPKRQASSAVSKAETSGFQSVAEDYFDDALFVGDSLTEGLQDYGKLKNAAYFYHVGLNIYQLFEKPQTSAQTDLTLEQTLKMKKYGKIYLMLGINEMGTGNTAYFVRHYSAALEKIRAIQPDAIIYIQSILYVTAEKSAGDKIFNNPNIRDRNNGLETLENRKKNIFYLDVNSAIDDGSGNMCAEYSGDGVHLKAKYYSLWQERLMKNAIAAG